MYSKDHKKMLKHVCTRWLSIGRYLVFSLLSQSYIELSKAPGVSQSNDAAYPRHQDVASK